MNKSPILIVGTKTLSLMIVDICRPLRIPIRGFIDDYMKVKIWQGKPIIGTVKHILHNQKKYKRYGVVVAIGDNKSRKVVAESFLSAGFHLASLVDPSSVVAKTATIEPGSIVFPLVYVGTNVIVKRGTVLLPNVTLTHDDVVGEYSFIAPHTVVEGRVRIRPMSKLKSGTIVASDTNI